VIIECCQLPNDKVLRLPKKHWHLDLIVDDAACYDWRQGVMGLAEYKAVYQRPFSSLSYISTPQNTILCSFLDYLVMFQRSSVCEGWDCLEGVIGAV